LDAPGVAWHDRSDSAGARREGHLRLAAGGALVLTQYLGISRDGAAAGLTARAAACAAQARTTGYDALGRAHDAAWAMLWRGRVIVEGDQRLHDQCEADLFQLYQQMPVDPRWPGYIAGLSSPAYYAGVFWDVDLWSAPAVLPFCNALAEGTARFRQRGLAEAMRRAYREGRPGAKYPWVACPLTTEENDHPGAIAEREIHIVGDVAVGQWWWWCANGDLGELRCTVYPLLRACADYICARSVWKPWNGNYEVLDVVCAEEGLGQVSNCLFTNAIFRRALQCASEAATLLGLAPDPLWATVAERIRLPRHRGTGLWQAHEGIDKPSEFGFVESLAIVIAELEADPAQLAAVAQAKPLTWDMSYQATVAALAGDRERFAAYLHAQIEPFVHTEFAARTEFRDNDAGPYLTGSGAMLNNLLFGAAGLRWRAGGLTPVHRPCLPAGATRITWPRLEWQGRCHSVTVDATGVQISDLGLPGGSQS